MSFDYGPPPLIVLLSIHRTTMEWYCQFGLFQAAIRSGGTASQPRELPTKLNLRWPVTVAPSTLLDKNPVVGYFAKTMGQIINLVGQKFGRLTVESLVSKGKRTLWKCACECGNHIITRGDSLTTSHTTSCGNCPNRITPFGDAVIIWMKHKGREVPTYIDAADYPLVKHHRWCVHVRPKTNKFYAIAHESENTSVFMHTLIVGVETVDHEDRDSLNNRRKNLRPSTKQQNEWNKDVRADSATGLKGVARERRKFYAYIRVNGKKRRLGLFNTALEAARVYNEAAKKYHGEFAVLNELPEDDLILNQKPDGGL